MRLSKYLGWIPASFCILAGTASPQLAHGSESSCVQPYPEAHQVDQVDLYHGVEVADPYRWLEDPENPARLQWIEDQVALSNEFFDGIPERAQLGARLMELWNYERVSCPSKEGDRYFWTKNDGLQNQSPLYVADGLDGEPRLLLDPNTLSEDGTDSLADYSVSNDGNRMAYSISTAGSDWRTVKVRDVATGEDLEDTIEWVKFSGLSWSADHEGFFYSRFDAPKEGQALQQNNEFHKVYYHKVGTEQKEDVLVHEDPSEPTHGFYAYATPDDRYLVLHTNEGCQEGNAIHIKDLKQRYGMLAPLFSDFEASYHYLGHEDETFYFLTSADAPMKRVIAVDLRDPSKENWRTVVPEGTECMEGASILGGYVVVEVLEDVHSEARVYSKEGEHLYNLPLPGAGCLGSIHGSPTDSEIFYGYSSPTNPGTIYRFDLNTEELRVHHSTNCAFDPEDFETEQVFYTSKDGTQIPMFITHKKGIELDGHNPCVLYGYGGFNISLLPWFNLPALAWAEQGGIFCVANLRGGGEYGTAWHEAGMKLQKQNVFDDFAAAGEFLCEKGYTQASQLGIMGGSNGGLLVGASLNQRPDLFAAGVAQVGVMDMLRFNQFTIGKAWESDYGSPENEDEFLALLAYSPYHNIQTEMPHPATLVTTSDHDDRVVPLHSYKYTAALQNAERFYSEDRPHIIRIAQNTGHGAGRSTEERIREVVDTFGFFTKILK